jgi:hypothetical protein
VSRSGTDVHSQLVTLVVPFFPSSTLSTTAKTSNSFSLDTSRVLATWLKATHVLLEKLVLSL